MKKKKDKGLVFKEIPKYEETENTEETLTQNNTEIQQPTKATKGKNEEKQATVVKRAPNRILQCFAYFSVALIAVVMIFRLIFQHSPKVLVYFERVSEFLAYIVCVWVGFYFTLKQKNKWWLVGWFISLIVLVVFYVFVLIQ